MKRIPKPQLSEEQRDREFEQLSEDDCGHIVAFVKDQYEGVFDAALAAFEAYQGSHLKAVA